MTALLSLSQVSASLAGKPVLNRVSFDIGSGELVALCGPNGAGKSSLLKASMGLLALSGGQVRMQGQDLSDLSPRQKGQRIAYLPQERRMAWNMPAIEVVALGLPFLSDVKALGLALEALSQVNIGHLAQRGVADMSGGERAKVLLARALVAQTPLLLADEPVAGLDPDAQLLVLECLKARAKAGSSVLVSLHDLSLAAQFADRVIVLDQASKVADDIPTRALTAERLQNVFRLDAKWIESENGPLLAARRLA